MEELPPSRELTLTEAGDTILQPGDAVVGLNRLVDFKQFELICARQVSGDPTPERSAWASKPLDTRITPKNFYGNIRGTAIIEALSPEEFEQQRNRFSPRQDPLQSNELLTAMLCIDLLRGRKMLGTIVRQVTYSKAASRSTHVTGITCARYLGPAQDMQRIETLAAAERTASVERARRLARYALLHPFGGGLPN